VRADDNEVLDEITRTNNDVAIAEEDKLSFETDLVPQILGINDDPDALGNSFPLSAGDPFEVAVRVTNNGTGTLPAGAEVDVYLLHLDPPETDVLTARGKIVFDRPIQGVIFTGERLAASEAQLRLAPARPPLEDEAVIGMTGPDQLSICDKRTALVFELTAGQALDQIRIVVDSAKADTSKADGGRQK